MISLTTSAVLAMTLALVAGAQAPQTAASKHAGIAGTVQDTSGHPIGHANVFVDGSAITTVSDDSGRFVLRGLTPGKNGFTITRIGYAPVSFETSLMVDSMLVLSIRMRSVQALDPVKVTAVRVNAYLARNGFMDRKKLGLGSFLTPEHIDSMAQVVVQPSQLLRDVRGIDLRCGGSTCVVHTRNPPDCLWMFVDGVYLGTDQIDVLGLTPTGIAAIEVYERPSIVPMELQGALPQKRGGGLSMAGGCGAIAVWTKARVP